MLKDAIASAFRSKGKSTMKRNELIMTLSYDLCMFSPEEAKRIVNLALEEGLLVGDEELSPTFDLEEKDVFDKIIESIEEKTGKSKGEIIAMINRRQEELGNLLSVEVVALLIAKEFGIDISNYIEEVEKKVLNQ